MLRCLGRVIREETSLQLSHACREVDPVLMNGEMAVEVWTDGSSPNLTIAGVVGFKYYCHDLCNSVAGIQTAMYWLDRGAPLPPLCY
ncbi:hypothetical protein BgiBS90_021209 [Biomphalaria glabrata]|nr:hypothetical protein BgiBS90_021209 [Biomphalaria glabrata]